jgi:hypothetical protein
LGHAKANGQAQENNDVILFHIYNLVFSERCIFMAKVAR